MRAADSATQNALQAAPETGLRERDLVWLRVRSLDGSGTAEFAFWNDVDNPTIQALRGDTGAAENRVYVGDGSLLKVSPIKLASDLTIQTVTVTLSQIHPTVQNMVRGYDVRQARMEIHRVLFDPRTNAVVSAAACHFVGKVNKAPLATPKSGEEGGVDLACVSHIRELRRTNSAKKSDETQKRRSGDRLRRLIGVANVKIFWGTAKERASGSASISSGGGNDSSAVRTTHSGGSK